MSTISLGHIEDFLQDALAQMPPELEGHGRGRPRILPSRCLWAGMLVCILQQQMGQSAIWRLLTQRQLWTYPQFPITDQAVYKRLEQAGTTSLEDLFAHISTLLQTRLMPYAQHQLAPFATAVVALDETTLDPVAHYLPAVADAPAQPLPVSSQRRLRVVDASHLRSRHTTGSLLRLHTRDCIPGICSTNNGAMTSP